ncbi:helix-turn-helix domain-containing protein [Bacillus sp. SM2101]|uniref:helix-turn-helix domain-containing protein n=1 Tax=Bacillus sp. SM2101 TaxID=2805366 RepID=UPI001BDF2D05|nr:helix-turn-helix domain-containing protein [Bacillus sp. SM2101]
MSNGNMANFIYELRKSKNMTQKQLAEKLNLTDKAVSKWERGLGYPDVSIISSLADILGVTANELLNGKRSVAASVEENTIIESTMQNADKVTATNKKSITLIAKYGFTIACLLGIFISMICDIAISGTFTWSLYPITAIPYAWLIIIPLFQFKRYKVFISLLSLSIFIIPFLVILSNIIGGTKLMLPLGIPVALIAISYMWGIFLLFSITKANKWYMASISVLLVIPVSFLINNIIAKNLNEPIIDTWDILSLGVLGIITIILFLKGKKQAV